MNNIDGTGQADVRLKALRRFAASITLLNIAGHLFLGFEQAWAHPIVALAVCYATELLIESVDAGVQRRRARFLGSTRTLVDFLLPAHITGLAVSMLLYSNALLTPIAFAAVVAIASKAVFRIRIDNGMRHFLNPSNTAITVTLLLFPFVGIAPPYQFTENLSGWADWLLPAILIVTGTLLNAKLTRRMPLIAAWLGGFALQAALRSALFDSSLAAALNPMTGVAFLLFTYYMVTDPATTPSAPRMQVLFGAAVAGVYGVLMVAHCVFGFFFALTAVCCARGLGISLLRQRVAQTSEAAPATTVVADRLRV